MRNQHRLCPLQMRVAGHDCVAGRAPLFDERARPVCKAFDHELDLSANIEPQVGGDLFVAAAAGVQLEAELSDALRELELDEVMNVLGGRVIAHQFLAGV